MPETPDLVVIARYLQERVVGRRIDALREFRPLALRVLTPDGDAQGFCAGRQITAVGTRAKYLLLTLEGERSIAINFMLAGALRHGTPDQPVRKRDYLALVLDDGSELRYHDPKGMGKVYLCTDLADVPGLGDVGPDALSPELTLAAFQARLRSHRGELKGVLTRGALVGGIGNAYADEILFRAGIYPFRRVSSLAPDEVTALFEAMRAVLTEAIAVLGERMGDEIDVKVRDFLAVHNKPGQPCPRCGRPISEVKSGQRATNFCRHCQPGSLIGQ